MSNLNELTGEFSIPKVRIDEFHKRFKKLEKLCDTIDVSRPTFTISEPYIVKKSTGRWDYFNHEYFYTKITYYDVTIEYAESIILPGGWQLLGVVDHRENIVNSVPKKVVPSKYFGTDGYCDHCNTQRPRKETFIVQDENGSVKQIGRQCLRKYLGVDGNGLFRVLQWFQTVNNLSNFDYEDFSTEIRHNLHFELKPLLLITAHWLQNHEYISQAKLENRAGLRLTSSVIRTLLDPPYTADEAEYVIELQNEMVELTDDLKAKLIELVDNAIEYVKSDTSNSSYMYNLKAIIDNDYYTWKSAGYAVSLVQAYLNHLAFIAKKKIENAETLNEHVGNVKDRIETEVKIVSSRPFESMWGSGVVYNFADKHGRRYVWFTSSYLDEEAEFGTNTFRAVKMTVKSHDEYKGMKQTAVNRVSLVK